MQVNSAFSTAATASTATNPVQSSDYQTFLNMLTVQMRNQDPLNPMAATDFAVQLATFSSVEQQMQTNQLLSALLGRSGLAEMSGWVGMEARIYSGAHFDGTPIDLAPDPALGAERNFLIVRNQDGAIVETVEIPTETHTYQWAGLDADGEPLPTGRYTFELESRMGDEVLDTSPVAAYLPIVEARLEAGMLVLVLPGGMLVDSSTISGLRQPRPTPAPDGALVGLY
ncbi:flagellar hook capping FlgD N-terminal domain-containing protein [Pararhodobacter sp.]|uniref:flagellar hook capping FlgD N-terminal domain-containing protein n=1 Tax=Pararhodobacter sp. TaxID=2127056 RepID=UPI002FDCD2A9